MGAPPPPPIVVDVVVVVVFIEPAPSESSLLPFLFGLSDRHVFFVHRLLTSAMFPAISTFAVVIVVGRRRGGGVGGMRYSATFAFSSQLYFIDSQAVWCCRVAFKWLYIKMWLIPSNFGLYLLLGIWDRGRRYMRLFESASCIECPTTTTKNRKCKAN